MSGGHDSTTVTHFAMSVLRKNIDFIAHINTGIGIEDTRQFVRDTCTQYDWPLREYKAAENVNGKGEPDPQIYADLVIERGFPGPFHHTKMYNRLKERPLRMLMRDVGASGRGKVKRPCVFISGVRREESTRRMGYVEEIQNRGREFWVAPFADLTKADTQRYHTENNLPVNSVWGKLCMSGECLCGAFARGESERAEIKLWYPEMDAYLTDLEAKVRANGHDWPWHGKPGKKAKTPVEDIETEGMPLCTHCISEVTT